MTRLARGKPYYRAPELLREAISRFNGKADIWSLGRIVFEAATGIKAFSRDYAMYEYGSTPRALLPTEHPSSDLFYLEDLLAIDPLTRPSAVQFKIWNKISQFLFLQ